MNGMRWIQSSKSIRHRRTRKKYYRINGKFFQKQSEITKPLSEALGKEGTAVLRTDYTLSDEEFMNIAQAVVEQSGQEELSGYYWMGVIYLTKEEMAEP